MDTHDSHTYGWSHNISWLAVVIAAAGVINQFILEMPKMPIVHIEFPDGVHNRYANKPRHYHQQ